MLRNVMKRGEIADHRHRRAFIAVRNETVAHQTGKKIQQKRDVIKFTKA